ncbi:MAG TPA: LysE family translocator [Acidimicrobiales bacterium]|nr:LysE family translocator [Acidimicrobiales bacterium]
MVIIAIPGPSVMFIVGRALSQGQRAALLTVVGNALGECFQVVVAAFGVGALIQRSVALFTVVQLIGAAYLVLLGVRKILERHSTLALLSSPVEPSSGPRLVFQGFTVGLTNPKTVVFLAAILPQFVLRSAGHIARRFCSSASSSQRSRWSPTAPGASPPVP